MKITEALENLGNKFTSGNSIPVSRATITFDEYKAIIDGLWDLIEQINVLEGNKNV